MFKIKVTTKQKYATLQKDVEIQDTYEKHNF